MTGGGKWYFCNFRLPYTGTRRLTELQRASLRDVGVISVMGESGAPNAFAEVSRLIGRPPLMNAVFMTPEMEDRSCAGRLQAFGTRSAAMTTALAVSRQSCWLALFAAVALANAGPFAVNETAPAPVSRTDAVPAAIPLASEFEQAVAPQLRPPPDVVTSYATRLGEALDSAGVRIERPQFVVLVDRSPKVQAVLLLWGSAGTVWRLVGAAPVSTGLPGRYEHFATPLGVFDHSLKNPDYRAEGTKNQFGIRGYGRKGTRVYDFGWARAAKGWGNGAISVMRLQMHATDPDHLEQRLGTAQSKGCIRIPASLNEFIDRHGVLDQDYQEKIEAGRRLWVLRDDRTPTPWSGRYLVVVDSMSSERPDWSAPPAAR